MAAVVHLDGEQKGPTPLEIGSLRPNRDYAVELSKPDYYSLDTTVVLAAGSISSFKFTLKRHQGWLSVTGSPEGSRLSVNEKRIGIIPLSRFTHPTGEYELIVKKPGYFPHREEFRLMLDEETELDVQLKRKPKGRAVLFSTIIPGTGQLYQGYSLRGLLFLAAGAAAAFLAQQSYASFTESQQQYETDLEAYNSLHSGDESEFTRLKQAANSSFRRMKDDEDQFFLMAGALGAVWTVNLVEVVF